MKFIYMNAGEAQRLADDLHQMEAGSVTMGSLSSAPSIEGHCMYSRRTACLSGYVLGQPSLPDGREIVTSQLIYMDTDLGLARTVNRWYRLGLPYGVRKV
ncbi:hypothetical protein KEU06_27200 [Pseudaminobacter sp. 19-2017]|uniref:Uncharacterized protein n=1 Tax=Pseudaminobacter soli (ex Zhang et al. 2022) TaxID=2831468 RepID=A0A942E6Z8_9HYPH|nr:DUF6634 family protein [Pseudaminobacter soli]MBS3652283.1 hypothetical protein [Pseudaminobacter soli]